MASGRRLEGKRALVTGASRGIGRAIAERLGSEGARVACGVRREEDGPGAVAAVEAAGGEGTWVRLDLTDPSSVATAVERASRPGRRIDVVVNSAGIDRATPLAGDALSDETWHATLDVNVSGPWRVLRAALPFLPDGARLVNLSSMSGRLGFPGEAACSASRHAVVGLTRALAKELAPRRITVNAVCPGRIDTDLGRDVMVLAPSEVAGLVAWLCSDDARYVTGQAIVLDGGLVMP